MTDTTAERLVVTRAATAEAGAKNAATEVVRWTDSAAWDAFLATASDATVAHRWAFTKVVPQAYGYEVVTLAAVRDGGLVGVLPLAHLRSRVFGRSLVSMPYLDTGGICSGGDQAAAAALLGAATELAAERRCHLVLRHLGERDLDMPAERHKVTMEVALDGGEDAVWSRIKSNRRGQVRKARRENLEVAVGGLDGLSGFFEVMARNMRDLGSPMHRRRYFASVGEELGDDARFVTVSRGGTTLAAGLLLFHADRAVLPWSSSVAAGRPLGANQLLYWEVARTAMARGVSVLDLGRSSPDSGTYEAKREWSAVPSQLCWHHWSPSGRTDASSTHESKAFELATATWRRLPVPVATRLGAMVRGGISQ